MKGWLKLLVLGAIPILAVTMVADQALAADKGSQLIFQANSDHTSFISVANANDNAAVTVLVQYYNESMELVTWYLRVITGGGNFLVNPFNHMIPGTGTEDDADGINVMEAIMGSGKASTHYVIAVTAVGANLEGLPAGVNEQLEVVLPDAGADPPVEVDARANEGPTANVLFPDYLAEDLDGTDNIDNGGVITSGGGAIQANGETRTPTGADDPILNNNLMQTKFDDMGMEDADDDTSKNVGKLTRFNAEPVAFNHLSGHFTEALVGGGMSTTDQTASWGGTPVIRPAVNNNNNMGMRADYSTLTGADTVADMAGMAAGRLAEKDAGGNEKIIYNEVAGWTNHGVNQDGDGDQIINNGPAFNRGLNGGALVLPAAHGGGVPGAKQIMLLLSAADDYEVDKDTGNYRLIPAKTGYMVTLLDNMGNSMMDADAADPPIFGGVTDEEAEDAKSAMIIVDGIQVWVDAGGCNDGDDDAPIMGPWTVGHLTELIDTGASGDFGGLETMGAIKFKRTALKCVVEYGDGDQAMLEALEAPDGVPIENNRTYDAGTQVVEEMNSERTFVTTGQALLKLLLPDATFAASWSLKSPPSSDDVPRVDAFDHDDDDTTTGINMTVDLTTARDPDDS